MPSPTFERRSSFEIRMNGVDAAACRRLRPLLDHILEICPMAILVESSGLIEPDHDLDEISRRGNIRIVEGDFVNIFEEDPS